MAIPVIESQQYTRNTSSTTSLLLSAPSGITAGDLLVIIIGSDYASTINPFFDQSTSAPSGWTFHGTVGSDTPDVHLGVFYKIATGSETSERVYGAATSYLGGWYLRISGAHAEYPLTVCSRKETSSGTTHVIPQTITPIDDCLALYAIVYDGADTDFSTPTGWTELDDTYFGPTNGSASYGSIAFGSKSMATAGVTGDASITVSLSDGSSSFQFAIIPADTTTTPGAPFIRAYSSATTGGAAASSITIPVPSSRKAGDMLFMIIQNDQSVSTGSQITDIALWNYISDDGSASSDACLKCSWKISDGTETSETWTMVSGTSYMTGFCFIIGNCNEYIDVIKSNEDAPSTSHSLDSITTNYDNCLMIYGISADASTSAPSIPSGYVEIEQISNGAGTAGMCGSFGFGIQATAGASGTKAFTTSATPGIRGTATIHIAVVGKGTFRDQPKIEGYAETSPEGSRTSLVMTAPSGITAGEMLYVSCHAGAVVAETTLTMSTAGWHWIAQQSNTSYLYLAAWWKLATGSEGNVTVAADNSCQMGGVYARISGVDAIYPIDSTFQGNLSTGTVQTISLPTTVLTESCLCVTTYVHDAGNNSLTERGYSVGEANKSMPSKHITWTTGSFGGDESGGLFTIPQFVVGYKPTYKIEASPTSARGVQLSVAFRPRIEPISDFPNTYNRKCSMTVNAAKVNGSTNLTGFPALITHNDLPDEVLDSDISTGPQSNGLDIRFSTDINGLYMLLHEIVHFTKNANPASATAEIWVQIPDLDYTTDTVIYMWWDTTLTVTNDYKNMVWSDYFFVSHDGGATDSSGNKTSTAQGTPTNTTNHLGVSTRGKALSSGEADGYSVTRLDQAPSDQDMTFQTWAKPSDPGGAMQGRLIFNLNTSDTTAVFLIHTEKGTSPTWSLAAGQYSGGALTPERYNTAGSYGSWQYVSAITNADAGYPGHTDVFVDTDITSTTTTGNWGIGTATTGTYLGTRNDLSTVADFQGDVSEFRFRKSAISSDWHITEYNNQIDDSTFWSAGTPIPAFIEYITKTPSDTLLPKIVDSAAKQIVFQIIAAADTLYPMLSGQAQFNVAYSTGDILAPFFVDAATKQTVFQILSAIDTLYPRVDSSTSVYIFVLFAIADYLMLDFPDEDYTYADVEAERENNGINVLWRFSEQLDYYGITNGDFDTLATSSFGLVKATATVVDAITQIFVSDILYPKIVDDIGLLLAIFQRTDTLSPKITETTINNLRSTRTDSLVISLAELTHNVIRSNVSDTLLPKVLETFQLLVSLSRSDDLLPMIDEINQIIVTFGISDTLFTLLNESVDIFSTLSRSDTLLPKVDETLTLLSRLARADTLTPKIDEVISIIELLKKVASDTLLPKIDEAMTILSSLSRSDTLLPKIDELISIFGTMTASDELKPKIDSIITLLVSLSRADTLLPKIDEIASLLVTLSGSDTLTPQILDLAEILWYTLEAFRFRDDDGSESSASWLGAQDAAINRAINLNTRLRLLLDTNSDAPALQLKLQYRPVGDPDWEWRDIT